MDRVAFTPKIDNIFEFGFMDDFTTIALAKEEQGIDILKLNYEDEEDFYCFSEKKVYTSEEIYKKFNVEVINLTDNEVRKLGYGYLL